MVVDSDVSCCLRTRVRSILPCHVLAYAFSILELGSTVGDTSRTGTVWCKNAARHSYSEEMIHRTKLLLFKASCFGKWSKITLEKKLLGTGCSRLLWDLDIVTKSIRAIKSLLMLEFCFIISTK